MLEIHSFPHGSPSFFDILSGLYFTVLLIRFECSQSASIFVAVMPLLELGILEIHSDTHFSPTGFNILIGNFKFDYCFFHVFFK